MKNGLIIIAIIAAIALIGGLIGYNLNKEQPKEQSIGSVGAGSIYQHTTATSTSFINPIIKTGNGTLGSVVINLLGTAPLTLYDATTTNVNLRAKATSTLNVLASIPASQAAGTYTYDIGFYDGLMAIWGTGTIASSTLTWR